MNKVITENKNYTQLNKLILAANNLLSHKLPNIMTEGKDNYIILELSDELPLSEAIIHYESKLRFIKFLRQNMMIRLSIEHRLERLAKFTEQSPINLLTK